MIEWFCTTCKFKWPSDEHHPHCPECGSGYVLSNEPLPPKPTE